MPTLNFFLQNLLEAKRGFDILVLSKPSQDQNQSYVGLVFDSVHTPALARKVTKEKGLFH